MIRVIKHILVEPTPDRHARIERITARIGAAFPEATTELVPGLLDDDLVVEVRLPLCQLDAWRAARARWADLDSTDDVEHRVSDPS
ncbi:hypothetical protein [Methylobacterium soli]|uniref:Uncharacterized protein n=1 Tax=Methylobacterium soli TaxID=553447 RepID=A0A6L3T2J2_9HYPH|nr:hypothetical protein [Methylobacterium soli]KAB1080948.1 hypothetical protein F6X53_04525 [Methylobacterium soli]GJE41196.1 hypothetical protein AEGHOMDF_0358 [Methylobacterium soli]